MQLALWPSCKGNLVDDLRMDKRFPKSPAVSQAAPNANSLALCMALQHARIISHKANKLMFDTYLVLIWIPHSVPKLSILSPSCKQLSGSCRMYYWPHFATS